MPSGTPRSVRKRAKTESNFLALQVRVRLTTVFSFRYLHHSGLAELIVLYEGTILAVVYDDHHLRMDLLGRGTRHWEIHIYEPLSFPPASLSLHALFQTLRRHGHRLLRQRLNFSTPSRVFVVSGIVVQHWSPRGNTNAPVGAHSDVDKVSAQVFALFVDFSM